MPSALSSTFEAQKPIGSWSPVCAVDPDLAAPLWIGHSGEKVALVRGFRTRGIRVVDRVRQVVGWAASYRDPGIMRVLETLEMDGGAGIAVVSMYDEGEPLASIFTKAHLARKPAPPSVAASIALDVLEALHAMGGRLAPAWAHGSLRPESILVGTGGRARIMEPGVVSTLAINDPLSQDPKWAAYAAPEQIRTGKPVGRSDIFTMGALLWEMAANEALVPARNFEELKRNMLQDPLERLKRQAPVAMPTPLMAVITQAIARRPEERFETPKAFAEAIESRCEVAEPYEVVVYLEELHGAALQTRRRQVETATGKPAPASPPRPRRKKVLAAPPPVAEGPPPLPAAAPPEIVAEEVVAAEMPDLSAEELADEAESLEQSVEAPPEEPPREEPPAASPPPAEPPPAEAPAQLPGLYDDSIAEPLPQRPTLVEGKGRAAAAAPVAAESAVPDQELVPPPRLPAAEPEPPPSLRPAPAKRAPAISAGDSMRDSIDAMMRPPKRRRWPMFLLGLLFGMATALGGAYAALRYRVHERPGFEWLRRQLPSPTAAPSTTPTAGAKCAPTAAPDATAAGEPTGAIVDPAPPTTASAEPSGEPTAEPTASASAKPTWKPPYPGWKPHGGKAPPPPP